MKKLLFSLMAVMAINCFAIDFSYAMTAEQAAQFIEENKDSENANIIAMSKQAYGIILISEGKTYQQIEEAIGNEYAANVVFQVLNNQLNSEYKNIAYSIIAPYIIKDSSLFNTNYFKTYIIVYTYYFNNEFFMKLRTIYTKDQVRTAIYESIITLLDNAIKAKTNYNVFIPRLNNIIKAYEKIYLDTNIDTAKAELKKLNARAFVLVDNDDFKEIVVKLRKLYKSLDI